MDTLEGYQKYIHTSKEYLVEAMRARMLYVEIKCRKLSKLHSSKDYNVFNKIIKDQEDMILTLKEKKHHLVHYALHHVDSVNCSKKIKKNLKCRLIQLSIMYTWIFSESRFLYAQKKALRRTFEYKVHNKGWLKYFFAKIFKNDLRANLIKEENELYLTMKVFEHRQKKFFDYNLRMHMLEKIARVDLVFLRVALFFNALPIHGIGDLLSLPFWLMYGVLQGYERTFKEYKDWKETKDVSLKKMHEELERISKTV